MPLAGDGSRCRWFWDDRLVFVLLLLLLLLLLALFVWLLVRLLCLVGEIFILELIGIDEDDSDSTRRFSLFLELSKYCVWSYRFDSSFDCPFVVLLGFGLFPRGIVGAEEIWGSFGRLEVEEGMSSGIVRSFLLKLLLLLFACDCYVVVAALGLFEVALLLLVLLV